MKAKELFFIFQLLITRVNIMNALQTILYVEDNPDDSEATLRQLQKK